MGKIVYFDHYLIHSKFKEQVVNFLNLNNFEFNSIFNYDESLIILYRGDILLIFDLIYIKEGEYTFHPTLKDSFNEVSHFYHCSSGEWVVRKIVQPKTNEGFDQVFSSQNLPAKDAINFLKKKLLM